MFLRCNWLSLFWMQILLLGANCLKNVGLKIKPKIVQKGHSAILECSYDLQNAPLYSLKFYRGIHEFYRYSPREVPTTKIFPFSGIQIDLRNSNSSQVTLSNIGFHLSGNFSCEVTTDAPPFSTAFVSEQMNVVVLPERHPIIRVGKETYRSGETLQANCSSAASRPPTNLMFFLNSVAQVRNAEIREEELDNLLIRSDLTMTVKLEPQHYQNGNVVLKCMAIIGDFYQQSTELQVDFHLKDPIVEKIMFYNGEGKSSSNNHLDHTTRSILLKLSTIMYIIVLSL